MAKTPINKKSKAKEKEDFLAVPYLSGVILIIFLVYSFSLFRTWQPFDERLIYNEELLPIPTSFNEISEVIESFVLNSHIISMNSFFSNNVTLRSAPILWSILVCILFFFKKNAVLYHLLQLFIHLINSLLVFFIFKKSTMILKEKNSPDNYELSIISIVTLIWALHSANTEAILLVTNWATLLTYTFCFCFLLYEVSSLNKNNSTILCLITTAISFCLLMFFTEYAYSLPLVIFFIVFSFAIKNSSSVNKAIITSLKKSLPYLLGLFLYLLLSLTNPDSTVSNIFKPQLNQSSLYAFFERNLWLTPQIFLHFLKLFFFPKILSTYQSNLTHLSDTLFSPYSLFSSFIYFLFLIAPFSLFILFKKSRKAFLLPLIYCFYFSLFPFLHIFTPTYCLIADRYCYLPSFFLLFFIVIGFSFSQKQYSKSLLIFLSCILLILTARTLIRIQDWKNPTSFYNSAFTAEEKPLYKGQKYLLLADLFNSQNMKVKAEDASQKSLNEFNTTINELKVLKEKHLNQPITLKLYGLDYDSLLLKAAHGIAIIKKNYSKESISNIIRDFEPYIDNRLDYSAPDEIAFYGEALLGNGELEKAKSVYETGYKKYPFVLELSLPLSDIYLNYDKDPDKALKILQRSYKYYPNKGMPMYKLLRYYEIKNDLLNQAKFAYLLGLREHSIESYQHAAQIYLDLKSLKKAKKTIDKSLELNPNNPLTLLQLVRYLDITGSKTNILEILNKAYLSNKASRINEPYITKSILENLININFRFGNIKIAKKYFNELENTEGLTNQDREQLSIVKERLFK